MPNVKSAIKRVRTSRVRRARNRRDRARLRTALKNVRQAKTPESAAEGLRHAVTLLDRFARRNVIHPNKAARLKSRLTRSVAQLRSAGS